MSAPKRWRLAERFDLGRTSETPLVVIGGCGSSGTTLLRHRLNRHPEIDCGPETTLFLTRITGAADLAARCGFSEAEIRRWQDLSATRAEFVTRFRSACLARSGKSIWADKTPENVRHFAALARRYPNARFVHVLRDGRDVACSLRRARWMKLEKITGGAERSSPEALAACARYWGERVRAGRRLAGSPRYTEVRYEDLVQRPEPTLRALLEFLGAPWDPRVLDHEATAGGRARGPLCEASIARWMEELSPAELAAVEREAGPELAALGYASNAERRSAARPWRLAPDATPASPPRRGRRLRAAWTAVRRDACALWLALRDPRLPRLARAVTALAALYLVAPFDVIPDRIPVFGYLDDLVALGAAGVVVLKIAPEALRRELRWTAAMRLSRRVWAA